MIKLEAIKERRLGLRISVGWEGGIRGEWGREQNETGTD
jgi:hypothetical protein